MVITTKPNNHKGAISNEYYNIRSPLSSTGFEIFFTKWSNSGKHTLRKKPTGNLRMESKMGRKKLEKLDGEKPSTASSSG